MAVAEAAAAAMEHNYNKNIVHITKENYYVQIQAGPLPPPSLPPPKKNENKRYHITPDNIKAYQEA